LYWQKYAEYNSNFSNCYAFARGKEKEFAELINQKSATETKKTIAAKERELDKSTRRVAELKTLFKRVYEDNVLGRVSDEQFQMLSSSYNDEQHLLEVSVKNLRTEIETLKDNALNADRFIGLAKQITDIAELTPDVLHMFVSRIEVGEKVRAEGAKKRSHSYTQAVTIYFTHIGKLGNDDDSTARHEEVTHRQELATAV
jgi:hypothetical protein